MGDGFWLDIEDRGSWTEYTAAMLDEPGGYVVAGRFSHHCRRRDAEAKIAEWRAEDARNDAASEAD